LAADVNLSRISLKRSRSGVDDIGSRFLMDLSVHFYGSFSASPINPFPAFCVSCRAHPHKQDINDWPVPEPQSKPLKLLTGTHHCASSTVLWISSATIRPFSSRTIAHFSAFFIISRDPIEYPDKSRVLEKNICLIEFSRGNAHNPKGPTIGVKL